MNLSNSEKISNGKPKENCIQMHHIKTPNNKNSYTGQRKFGFDCMAL